jgi:hypothetical protein
MKKNFIIKAKVWRWPGDGGWHFVTLDKKLSEGIRKIYTRGFVKIEAKVGKTAWNTSLFPHMVNKKVSKQIEYLLCINKKLMKAEGIFAGDEIKINIKVI